MLVRQAMEQFRLFTGSDYPADALQSFRKAGIENFFTIYES